MIIENPIMILVYTLVILGLLVVSALVGLVGYVTFFKQH